MAGEKAIRAAVERLDVLEDELPRENCQVKSCSRQGHYAWAGNWGTRWLCSRHLPLYRRHDQILSRIRKLR